MPTAAPTSLDWPGKRLGLPANGPRSIGRMGRRLGALAIDWGLSVLSSVAFFHYDPTATLLIFYVTQVIFVLTLGSSIGHLVAGLRVVPVRGEYLGVWRPLVRAALICLVIPVAIWDNDQRGMHDRICGTVLLRR